jgi:hypothetical protein
MPRSSPNQTNFLGGEFSQVAQGRTEDPRYAIGLATCSNCYPAEEGALLRRPGTEFIAYPYQGEQPRLITFEGEAFAAYVCEFTVHGGQGYLRFIQGNSLVVDYDSGSPAVISATNTANPVQVTVSAPPATWATGDQAILFWPTPYAVADMAGLADQVLTLTKVDSTHYTLKDSNGATVNGTGWSTKLVNAALRRVTRLTTAYTTVAQLEGLRLVQNEQLAVLLTYGVAPQTLTECPTFSIAQTAFIDGPYLSTPQTMTATVSGYTGAITLTAASAAFATTDTSGSGGTGTFNRHVRIFTEPAAWASGTTYGAGDHVKYNGNYWISNIASNVGYPPGTAPVISGVATVAWAPVAARGVAGWAWGQITAYTSTTVVTVTLPTGQALITANGTSIAANNWYLGAFCDSLGYPTCGCYHEGRLWLGGYAANRFDASTVTDPTLYAGSGFLCFSTTDVDGTVNDSNAISYTLNAVDLNQIQWMMSDQSGIVCGTLAREFLISATTANDPLTPTDIQAHSISKYGSANIQPLQAGMAICFVHRYQQRLMEYLSDTFSQRWAAKHLNEFAKHLSASGIAELAYQEELTPIVWARMYDGSLAGVTYRRVSRFVSENPVFAGWHRHAIGNDVSVAINKTRLVQSMAVCPQPMGLQDRLYLATCRSDFTHRRLEVFSPVMRETDGLGSSWYVDESPCSALTPYFNNCTAAQTAYNDTINAITTGGVTPGTYPPLFGPGGYYPTGDAPTGGSTPSRHGPTGSGTYAPTPSQLPIDFTVLEAVLADGYTCLYGLPTSLHNAGNVSISMWVPASDISVAYSGCILGGPLKKLVDYQNKIGAGTCNMTPASPTPIQSFYLGLGFTTWVYAGTGTDYLALDVGWGGSAGDLSFLGSITSTWVHLMLSYKASTRTVQVYANNVSVGSYTINWTAVPAAADGSPHHCWASAASNPSTFNLPNIADNADTTFGANNVWTLFGHSWTGGPRLLQGEVLADGSVGSIYNPDYGLAGGLYMGVGPGQNGYTTFPYTCLPGDGNGLQSSMFEFWLDTSYIDWSVQANREKFHGSELDAAVTGNFVPISLGAAGQAPLGGGTNYPKIYLSSSVEGMGPGVTPGKAFTWNRASGKYLSVYGAFQTSPLPPPS